MSKRCSKCKKTKALSEFGTRTKSSAKGNKTYVRSLCKRCQYEACKAWQNANREKYNQQQREGRARKKAGIKRKPRQTHEEIVAKQKKRYREDPNFKLCCTLRSRLGMALKHNLKSAARWVARYYCGASRAAFESHSCGMSWDNHGKGEGKWK